MPEIAGRWVPDDHAAAVGHAGTEPEENEENEENEEVSPKRATRKRRGQTVETAMVDEGGDVRG